MKHLDFGGFARFMATLVAGAVFAIAVQFGMQVYAKWDALIVAWEHTDIVKSLEIEQPKFTLKK